jgi:hypothetical protein
MEIIWKNDHEDQDRITMRTSSFTTTTRMRPVRGTGTALIETKLAMQLAQRDSRPGVQIFLDLTKAFDSTIASDCCASL